MIQIDEQLAQRIAELLDTFAELPSTPPVMVDDARECAAELTERITDHHSERTFGH